MQPLSLIETHEWLAERSLTAVDGDHVKVLGPVSVLETKIPDLVEASRQLPLYLLAVERALGFNGGLLLFTDWQAIGDSVSRTLLERLRLSYHISGSVADYPAQQFSPEEYNDLEVFFTLPFIFGQDCYFVPTNRSYLIFVSHDRYCYVVIRHDSTSVEIGFPSEASLHNVRPGTFWSSFFNIGLG